MASKRPKVSTGDKPILGQIIDLGAISTGRPRLAPMPNDCSAERSQVFTMCGSYAKYDRDWSTAMFANVCAWAEIAINANVCAWAEIAINAVQSPNSIMPRQERFMFTQQHYEKIADLMHSERVKLRRLHGPKYTETPELLALNDMTMGFVAMFNKDNPKFRELIFIERCNRDLHENS